MAAFWDRRRGGREPNREPKRPEEVLASVRWLSAAESPFGVEVLDCSEFAGTMISMTQDKHVSDRYLEQRGVDGLELLGHSPDGSVTSACALEYPHQGATRDGPLFKAEAMEDKWDIYLYAEHLYFTRSWTGELIVRARLVFEAERARMVEVETAARAYNGDAHAVASVDYLIRSHLHRWIVPHPFPEGAGRDPAALALLSFAEFGRRGWFGTYAGTTSLAPLVPGD